ncbi:hypothetical protein ACFLT4_01700 [Chloroflexota bacterium]
MIFERIKSAGIAHNSYLLGSGSDAAVIDPRRAWYQHTAQGWLSEGIQCSRQRQSLGGCWFSCHH